MYGMNGMSWGMGFGWFFGIIVLILVIWAITKGLNANKNSTPTERKSALEILKERYARGEINKEEFEKIKQNIL